MTTSLSQSQKEAELLIENYGKRNGSRSEDTAYAVKTAYIESSLTSNAGGPGSSTGLYQYKDANWHDNHRELNKNSPADQIEAFFEDMKVFSDMYENSADGKAAHVAGLTREEFMYSKHHDGRYSHPSATSPGKKIWDASNFEPATHAAGGTGGAGEGTDQKPGDGSGFNPGGIGNIGGFGPVPGGGGHWIPQLTVPDVGAQAAEEPMTSLPCHFHIEATIIGNGLEYSSII